MNNVNNMYYQNYSNVNDITNIQNEEVLQKDLTSTKEGFKRGNIFANLYWPYRKQTYNFVPKNDRQRLLLDIMENGFYAHELNLYLDNDPFNQEMLEKYKKYVEELKKATKEYEKIYGPLTVTGVKQKDWTWVNDPWPWENN